MEITGKVHCLFEQSGTFKNEFIKLGIPYWFINCEPTNGKSYQNDKEQKTIMKSKGSAKAGICSEERSMIHPDYARNFICDFILGKVQPHTIPTLF